MGSVKLTKYWFLIYVLAALLVLATLLNLGLHYGPQLEAWLMLKFVPEAWQATVDDLVHRFFREELRAFLTTSGFGLGIIVIGLTLFPLKEKLSATYEAECFPELARHPQPPLWRQGLEEVKLALLYLLLQGMSFYLAVQGLDTLARLGAALSLAYLVAAMTLDHCAPFFQRRGRKIHGILWILLRRAPLRSALIGIACIGPVLLLERFLPASLAPPIAIALLVFTEVLGMACATLLGCWLGAVLVKKHPALASQKPPALWTIFYRSFVLTLALWLGIFFGWWARGAYTHFHFMQSRYRPLWDATEFKVRDSAVLVTLPVEVKNRSQGTIDPTELRVTVKGEGLVNGDVTLQGPTIAPGETTQLTLTFTANLTQNALLDLPRFLEQEYSAHLTLHPPLSQPVLIQIFPQEKE